MESIQKTIYFASPPFIQTLGLNIYEIKEYLDLRCKLFNEYMRLLNISESWGVEELEKFQNKNFVKIVHYAYKNVPFYNKLYKKLSIDIHDIKSAKDIRKLPIVKKEDIMWNFHDLTSNNRQKHILVHTSGTTGKPLELKISKNLDLLFKALAFRRDLWAGITQKDWRGRFVGDSPVKGCEDRKLFRASYVMKRAIFPSYCLDLNNIKKIFISLKKLSINCIQAYPSTAYILSKYLESRDEYYPIKALLYSSEPMYNFQRDLIEERFKTKTFGFYGQAERVFSATECEYENYHISGIDGIMQVLDSNNDSVSDGKKGFTVVTSLHNYSMPLIRYALDDFTGYKNDECPCGRNLPLIFNIETKYIDDFVITPNHRLISPSLITFPLKHAKNIIESQLIQENLNKVVLKIVPQNNFSSYDEMILTNEFKKLLGNEMEFNISYVNSITRTNTFKKRLVINRLGRDYVRKVFEEYE